MEGKALNFGQKGACLKTGNLRSGSKGRSCAICGRLSSPHFANDGKALLGTQDNTLSPLRDCNVGFHLLRLKSGAA